jgi:phospholipase C
MGAPVTKRLERAEAVAPMHDLVENEADTRPAVRTATADGSNFANTLLMVGWDERGGTNDHVVPPRVDPPDLTAPTGELGFQFDRAGVRIPTLAVSANIDAQTVVTDTYRNTSLIQTLHKRWNLGPPLTRRDATAPDIAPVLTRSTPRPKRTGPT